MCDDPIGEVSPVTRLSSGTEVAPGVFRMGTRYVNWYLVEDRGALTLIDTGLPGYWPQLTETLRARGRRPSDVEAVVITHHHPDHRGSARRAREETRARVFVHERDGAYVRGDERLSLLGVWKFLWRPWYIGYISHLVRNGVLSPAPLTDLARIEDGEVLDAPGQPQVIHVPGHTPGSTAIYLRDRRVLFTGDALVTLDTARGRRGPCILTGPVTADAGQARRSLAKLKTIDADVLLPGHGEPWRDGTAAAVEEANRAIA